MLPYHRKKIASLKRLPTLAIAALLSINALTGCKSSVQKSIQELPSTSQIHELPASPQPTLEVVEGPYTFTMYPEYLSEEKSRLKLGICDKQKILLHPSKIVATLIANDGHRQSAKFVEDQNIQKFVSEIALRHHEDYVVETDITLPAAPGHFRPKFSFHCCDPIPELLDRPATDDVEGGKSK
jgi:hypothetical protein